MKTLVSGSFIPLILALGCVGEAPRGVHLTLTANGDGKLVLDGSPVDPGYQATYTNPRGITRMEVSLSGTGRLIGVCRGPDGVVPCGDVPFFSRVELTDTGRIVRAWDLHGKLVVVYNCAGGPDVCGDDSAEEAAEDEPEGDEVCPDGGDEVEGEDDEDGEDGAEDGEDGGDAEDDDAYTGTPRTGGAVCEGDAPVAECPPPPTDCAALELWARDCLCATVNANLVEFGVAYTLDCASLDGDMEIPELDTDYEGEIACQDDLIGEEGEEIEEAAEACPAAEVAVNNWISEIDYELRSQGMCGHSPLVLDLAGDGVALTTLEEGTRFDLFGTGAAVSCAWVRGDDALLVLDRNGNGAVDGAAELFGNATGLASWSDGFAALAELDADASGRLDAADPAFADLRLLTGAGHLVTLEAAGVTSLGLEAVRRVGRESWDGRGNRIPLVADFERADGSRAALVDAWLRFRRD